MKHWFKGNLHAHTTNSDGDSSPFTVAAWYGAHGYDFLALTDHDVFTDPALVVGGKGSPILLIGAEELSPGDVHVNGFGISSTVPPIRADGVAETIQANVDAIRAAGGIASINHPNYRWAISGHHLGSLRGVRLIEVYNGEPSVNNGGDAEHPSVETLWDAVLRQGQRLFGLAVDDAHHFERWGTQYSNPGRGFVRVLAERLTEGAILEALVAGAFYASSGVELDELVVDFDGTISLSIAGPAATAHTTTFIGPVGVLDVQTGRSASYRPGPGGLSFVRARVDDSDGHSAWIQPVFSPPRS